MTMNEKKLVATLTLVGSLTSYYYAKTHDKDAIPYLMIGGYVGGWVGELIFKMMEIKAEEKREKDGEEKSKTL